MFVTSLDFLLELAACCEFSRRFCGLFPHHEHQRADRWKRNFGVIGGRLTRFRPCHRHQSRKVAYQHRRRIKHVMASRAIRPHVLLDLSVPRVSQRLWGKRPVRGAHSQTVDLAFASQLDAVDLLAKIPGQERSSNNTSLYSLSAQISIF